MDILNLKRQYMSSSGSSVLRGISSEQLLLDLFVRESVQNSFDAKNKSEDHIKEEFNCGDFDSVRLSSMFSGINEKLLLESKYTLNNKFISVRDYNTSGLTGPTRIEDIQGDDWGKFLNLVRNFGKSKKEEGSGGSWGYGKTTFYKLGIGIVIYYSRIKNNNLFEERLMCCLVESEQNNNGLLYDIQKPENTGIAWWGKLNDKKDDILPISNHEEIKNILNCFNLKPYENEETGTAVIIPYVNENALLNQTSTTGSIEENTLSSWCYSLEDYIEMAFQRWYPTRCNNKGKVDYIDTYINEKLIEKNKMYPVFDVIQHMYNFHFGYKEELPYQIFKQEISYKNERNFKSKNIGNLYYCMLDKKELKMNVPYNYASPVEHITNQLDYTEDYINIICFCRKPGMILKYDVKGEWLGDIKSPDPTKYLIGIFIPNSENTFEIDGKTISLDDYLRASESAEHNDWHEINEYTFTDTGEKVDCSKITPVGFIQRRLKSIFENISHQENQTSTSFVGTALNQKLAKLFLPSRGFGTKSGERRLPTTSAPSKQNRAKSTFKIGNLLVDKDQNLGKQFEINFNKKDKKILLEFKVNTESGEISANKWEENMPMPIIIKCIKIENVIFFDEQVEEINKAYDQDINADIFNFGKVTSNLGSWYGFYIESTNDSLAEVKGKIIYDVIDPTISVNIVRVKESE